ncbi:hypothetical protein HDU81_006075 [Chytriomyces hyalinus]|nr:hypothetical protein HDU81_006075 [Chytriomyces hyalinus]
MDHSAHNHDHASAPKSVTVPGTLSQSAHVHSESHGSAHTMSHGMSMTFNWGYETELLFTSWKTSGPMSMYLLCIAVFLMAFGHEYLQYQRNILEARHSRLLDNSRGSNAPADDDLELSQSTTSSTSLNNSLLTSLNKLSGGSSKAQFEKSHMMRTLFHVGSSFSSLVIMTVFMTLNMWLVLAILAGTGVGFYMFQGKTRGGSKGVQCH